MMLSHDHLAPHKHTSQLTSKSDTPCTSYCFARRSVLFYMIHYILWRVRLDTVGSGQEATVFSTSASRFKWPCSLVLSFWLISFLKLDTVLETTFLRALCSSSGETSCSKSPPFAPDTTRNPAYCRVVTTSISGVSVGVCIVGMRDDECMWRYE